MKYLFLENKKGKVIQNNSFVISVPLFAIRRMRHRSFRVMDRSEFLKQIKDIPVQVLSFYARRVISKEGLSIPFVGILKQRRILESNYSMI